MPYSRPSHAHQSTVAADLSLANNSMQAGYQTAAGLTRLDISDPTPIATTASSTTH
jgi:hypothetical protein